MTTTPDGFDFPTWTFRGAFASRRHLVAEARFVPGERRADALPPEIAAAAVDGWVRDPWGQRDLEDVAAALNRAPSRAFDARDAAIFVRQVVVDALRYGTLLAFEDRSAHAPIGGRRGAGDEVESAPPPPPRVEQVEQKTWIEIRLADQDGEPIGGARYRLELPDGQVREGTLSKEGRARLSGIDPGSCAISFPDIDGGEWTS